jgi:hypothetical protein
MPSPVIVNPMNTARAYIAASAVTLAPEEITSIEAKMVIKNIPFENASR